MGISRQTYYVYAAASLIAALYGAKGYPAKESVKLSSRSADGGLDIKFDSEKVPEEEMDEKMKEIFAMLDTLDVEAVYQRQVNLERLVGDSGQENKVQNPSDSNLPKYVISREEKIYFFTDPSKLASEYVSDPGDSTKDQGTPEKAVDGEDVLEKYVAVAKKHVNNPPPWVKKVSDDPSKDAKLYKNNPKLEQLVSNLKKYMNTNK